MLFNIHLVTTLMMAGIIWFVQIVHYPLFQEVGAGKFVVYENQHTTRTGWIIAPIMVLELVTGIAILWGKSAVVPDLLVWGGIALLVVLWGSTFLIQVPCHRVLSEQYDPLIIRRLISSNWIRTIGWSVRAVIVIQMAPYYI